MRGIKDFNFPAFDAATATLRSLGHTVISPAEKDREAGFDPTLNTLDGFDVQKALADDFRYILDCDGIVLLDGWERSAGARAERFVAEITGRKVWGLNDCDSRVFASPCLHLEKADDWDGDPRVPTEGENVRDEDVEAAVKAGKEWAKEWREATKPGLACGVAHGPEGCPGYPTLSTRPAGTVLGLALDEVRITDPVTGGQKGQKVERHDLIPVGPLKQLATHYGLGALKYADRNWERGYAWSLSYGALQRHLTAFWNGEDIDADTGGTHLAAAAFHVFALMEYSVTHPELDDRPHRA